jgi:lipooligosaccharide transport system permease protein
MTLSNPFTIGTYRVWQRNRDASLRLWKTELWPPFAEAVMTLVAFGYGLGMYIKGDVEGTSYMQFIAPAIVMTAVLFTASFECMFGTYFRMKIEKVFDAIIATPITIEEVVSAEVMWAATRAAFTGFAVMTVLLVMGMVPSAWAITIPFICFITGFMLGAIAVMVTSFVPSINSFNYYITLGVIPMQLFSGVYFPVSSMSDAMRTVAYISPFYPCVQLTRAVFNGWITADLLGYLAWILALSVVAYFFAVNLMRRRLIK